ncbi:MAG: SGNH/GDSL hydrolase family protein [Chloroflexi bacterium]|nr:SGNH/GDSL hydrolase family protein [Chloroflexota bacterium]
MNKINRGIAVLFAWLLIAAGLALALFGLLLDYILLGSQPGISLPQILVVAAGAGLAMFGWWLRHYKPSPDLRANLSKALVITLITLFALEIGLGLLDFSTYYPNDLPEVKAQVADEKPCGELGCRILPQLSKQACATLAQVPPRFCILNALGYADTDEFVATADLAQRDRVLFLGDSFTHGFSADLGRSFVETVESALPDMAIWNLGIGGLGTVHALASFRGIAPIMQPQLTILGFFADNDFYDNQFRIESRVALLTEDKFASLLNTELRGRWGGNFFSDPELILQYRPHGIYPPPNEAERLIGLTRLGTLFLRSLDTFSQAIGTSQQRLEAHITRDYLVQLRDEAAAQNSQFLTLLIPAKRDFAALTNEYMTALALLRELGIPHMEVMGQLDAATDYQANDDHWNNSGHGKVGALLAECIDAFFAAGSLSACDRVVMP